MNVKKIALFASPFLLLGFMLLTYSNTPENQYFPRNSRMVVNSADGFLEYQRMIKANQFTGEINPADIQRGRLQADKMPKSKSIDRWSFKGPDNVGGRTRAIAVDRNNSNHILAGGVAGGVWESFDGANSWAPYDEDFTHLYVNCIVQDAAGDFYIGTGGHFEGGGNGFNSQNSKNRSYFFTGSGLHKLTGSSTYETIVEPDYSSSNSAEADWATIGNIAADPITPGKLYVAANQGFRVLTISGANVIEESPINYDYKCMDVSVGSNGNVLVSFKDETPGLAGLAREPGTVFASSDGMQTWDSTSFGATANVSAAGRIKVAIAPSDPSIMYLAAAEDTHIPNTDDCLYGLFRSQDAGKTWETIEPGGANGIYNNTIGCQGYWDNLLAVSPINSGKIFIGGVTLHTWEQSSVDPAPSNGSLRQIDDNQGSAFGRPSGQPTFNYVHSDKHYLVFDPNNPNVGYVATDGGVFKSFNVNSQFPSFTESNYNYNVTAYYDIGINGNDLAMGGTQDNGTHILGYKYNNNLSGNKVIGGDGFDAELSSINPNIGVGTLYFNTLQRVQGIGSGKLTNANISTAELMRDVPFFGALCTSTTGSTLCQGPFYTTVKLWESFEHEKSTDTAYIDTNVTAFDDPKDLPPFLPGTIFAFESNNNPSILQYDTIPDSIDVNFPNLPPMMVKNEGEFPEDTLIGDLEDNTYLISELANATKIVNYDKIVVDTTNKTIFVEKHPDNSTLLLNYQEGTPVLFDNAITTPKGVQTSVIVNTNSDGKKEVTFIHGQITFAYSMPAKDKIQSILASANWPGSSGGNVDGSQRNILISRDLLKVRATLRWYSIAGERSTPDPITTQVIALEFTTDGNTLFAGTTDGKLYRITDIDNLLTNARVPGNQLQIYDIQEGVMRNKCQLIADFDQAITDISVDPIESNRMVLSLGNYGNTNYIARTRMAMTADTSDSNAFEFIDGVGSSALPQVPAYSVLIDKNDSNRVFLGTDLGVYSTDEAFKSGSNVVWSEENAGLGRAPVYAIEQMRFSFEEINAVLISEVEKIKRDGYVIIPPDTIYDQRVIDSVIKSLEMQYFGLGNEGKMYIGTHGRGIFETDKYVGIAERNNDAAIGNQFENTFKIYPNPARGVLNLSFKVEDKGNVEIQIFDLQGRMVSNEMYRNLNTDTYNQRIDISSLSNGTYIVRAINGDSVSSSKLVVYK